MYITPSLISGCALAALLFTAQREAPNRSQLIDVVGVQRVQGAVALALQAQDRW